MRTRTVAATLAILSLVGTSVAAAAESAGDGKPFRNGRSFAELSGFEGNEAALGTAVAKAILAVSPTKGPEHDFSGREEVLGQGVATVIRTLNVREPYQHETNDALVKMTLTYIQFAKDHELLDDMVEHELRTQMPMLTRVGRMIEKSGNTELALIAMTDRTACFYQLVQEVERSPGSIRFKSPFGNVLAVTQRLGQHDLTEKEIHEIWTKPRFERQADMMGVKVEVSEIDADGWVTMTVMPPAGLAAAR